MSLSVPNPSDEPEVDEIDLEAHARAGHPHVPRAKAKRYIITIDRARYTVGVPEMTGKEILRLAGHTPESHKLFEKVRGGRPEPVAPDQVVNLRKPGVERFQTIPIDPGEGIEIRRHFELPEEDVQALDSLGLPWETVNDDGRRIVLVHEFHTDSRYDHAKVLAALQLSAGYADTQIDMVYFWPPLARLDGRPIPATDGRVTFDQKAFQQWSRHRTASNPWRPGVDGIGTHLLMVEDWLRREFTKN
ncbi:MAG: multiubiquitin domain-containing protein [Planctomycetes bacterium]|nr:multiubiquitin domain-containing protein [Planctomycetota bacterium]